MKKVKELFIILFFAFCVLFFTNNSYCAEPVTANTTEGSNTFNWSYTLNNNNEVINLKCTNLSDISGNITIPSKIDGKNVVAIGSEAFKNCTGITGVIIPNSVKSIYSDAFKNCKKLVNVNLGNITTIGSHAFQECEELQKITIPKTLNSTNGIYLIFDECTKLTQIEFEDGLEVIPSCLCGWTNITSITIPASVKSIQSDVFKNCPDLKKITILDNVTSIKYVLLPKTVSETPADDDVSVPTTQTDDTTTDTSTTTKKLDTTTIKQTIPYTGLTATIIVAIIAIGIVGTISYVRYRSYKDIK